MKNSILSMIAAIRAGLAGGRGACGRCCGFPDLRL
jgi:hypothetical protein